MTYSEIVISEIQNGNLDEAELNLDLALESDDEETLYLLGNTLYQLGFLIETKKVYNHLMELNPSDDELKIYLAEIEIEDGNELEALDILHKIDETSSSYPQSLLVQADYYHINELPEVSIQKLKEAEELLPEEPIIQFALAEVYFTIADYQNAIKYYEDLTVGGYDEVAGTLISVRLGNAYMMIGQYKDAIEYFDEALTFKDDPEVYYQLGLVYVQSEEFSKAIKPLEQAKALDPSLSGVYVVLSQVYEEQNKLNEALKEIEEGITFNEINIDFYFKAAELAAKLHDHEKTEKYYKDAIEIEPGNDRTYLKYAEYLTYMESYEEVIELLSQASETTRQLPEALWILAVANNNMDEYDKARELFDQAAVYLEDDLDFLKEYAFFLREDGQTDKMREIVQKYQTLNPELDEEIASLIAGLDDIY